MDEPETSSNNKRTVVEPATVKAFIAGLLIGNLNKAVLLGFTIGTLGGIFIQQNVAGVPNITQTWKDLLHRWKRTGDDSNPNK